MTFDNYNLKDLSDIKLCTMVRHGNDLAFNEIVNRYSSLIKTKSFQYSAENLDGDDFFQEGTLSLLNAVKSYHPDSDTSFKTYAGICIERKFISLIKYGNRKKRMPQENIVSLNSVGEEKLSNAIEKNSDPIDLLIEKELLSFKKEQIKNILSPLEYKVFSLHIVGYRYKRISKILNISLKAVDNSIQRVKNKLRSLENL
ncbi:MAG: RNA polymerase sigma-H factor [Eubacteriales bacterium SKADARSKE-1]|nr:RNA polymerase sigma-H factor [Eubacteriales bacterium SKADARSKE-1]